MLNSLRAMSEVVVWTRKQLNTWLEKCLARFHSMECAAVRARSGEIRTKLATWNLTFDAHPHEASGELNRCLT
jgi:hypothetical protein